MILEDVLAARVRIRHDIHKTPLLSSRVLSEQLGCELWLKAEHLQKTGSFKARGVSNYLARLEPRFKTVTTFSSGNHGQALAWAAQRHGRTAVIFMPEDARTNKVAAVQGYGGEVRLAGFSSNDRRAACEAYAKESGAHIVPPYDHEWIIAGQGTCMLEVLEEQPFFDAVLLPCGGGGLLSGNALVLSNVRPGTEIYACEPALADDLRRSLEAGKLTEIEYPATIADGARNLCVGKRNWEIIRRTVRDVLTCSETQIAEAAVALAAYSKQIVEPTGAVALAALGANRERFQGKRVLVVLSGGNIRPRDFAALVGEHDH